MRDSRSLLACMERWGMYLDLAAALKMFARADPALDRDGDGDADLRDWAIVSAQLTGVTQ